MTVKWKSQNNIDEVSVSISLINFIQHPKERGNSLEASKFFI